MLAVAKLPESRTYNRLECITFRKTAEKFGGLSNMAGGYLLNVNGVKILTSEALYQACRFPHLPEVQRLIIAERSPMTAIETGDLPIVEDSRKDDFWGAKPEDEEILTGANVLGRLLMQVREQIKTGEITSETIVKPLPIQNFLLYGQEISSVSANSEYHLDNYRDLLDFNKVNNQPDSEVVLPDTPMLESDFNGKNTINSHVSAESIESEHQKYDASQIMMPYIIGSLKTERTDKELVELFENTDLKIMRKWLDRAVELGKVRKLSKPVRYIAESQLTLIN